jgi:Mg/Co/Ni transporter MgtE
MQRESRLPGWPTVLPVAADEKLAAAFLSRRPGVAARLLETMEPGKAVEVLEASPASIAAAVLYRMLPSSSARCAERMAMNKIVSLLEHLPVVTGATLLRHFAQPARQDVLRQIGATRAAALRLLLRYPANAVGAWMNPGVLTISGDYSVSEAADLLEHDDHAEPRVYVLDRDRRPRGAVRGMTLLRRVHKGDLGSIVEPVESIWARESLIAAQRHECWEWQSEAPVVNRLGKFVGSITFAELIKGQRSAQKTSSSSSAGESLTELTELFWHGADGLWSSLREIVQPESMRRAGGPDEHGA